MRAAFLLVPILTVLNAAPPKSIEPLRPQLTRQANDGDNAVWHTRRFEIRSDVELPPTELSRLAKVADTTARAVEAYNPAIYAPPPGKRLKIAILGSDEAFLREGGQPESAGMYLWRKQIVILNANHLFSSRPGSRLKPSANEDLMVHEISHLCMHGVQPRLPQWLNEGLCEYFACAHRGGGQFKFEGMESEIRDHLKRHNNSVDPKIPLSSVVDVAPLNSRGWSKFLGFLSPEQRYHPYATALLLTHYHLHGGPERLKRLETALARRSPKDPDPFKAVVTEADTIEQAIYRFWKPKGLQPTFKRSN